jgi:hypothetical protein
MLLFNLMCSSSNNIYAIKVWVDVSDLIINSQPFPIYSCPNLFVYDLPDMPCSLLILSFPFSFLSHSKI